MDVTYDATKRELSTDQGTIRYHEAGDPSAPPLVLLHGSGPGVTGWRNYRGNLGFFAQTHHCYVIEFDSSVLQFEYAFNYEIRLLINIQQGSEYRATMRGS